MLFDAFLFCTFQNEISWCHRHQASIMVVAEWGSKEVFTFYRANTSSSVLLLPLYGKRRMMMTNHLKSGTGQIGNLFKWAEVQMIPKGETCWRPKVRLKTPSWMYLDLRRNLVWGHSLEKVVLFTIVTRILQTLTFLWESHIKHTVTICSELDTVTICMDFDDTKKLRKMNANEFEMFKKGGVIKVGWGWGPLS